jgi:3-hydroxyacyl-CoA dehydrogenase / enoyl-CoA hydratase / 3-hydroxybutyryl-CoA epimerase
MEQSAIIQLAVTPTGVGVAVIDLPGEKLNVLKRQALEELEAIITQAETDANIVALVIISGKEDNFLAGADITMFGEFRNAADAYEGSRAGQKLFSRLYDLPKPVVCAINGTCLGGGLELALNAHYRIATDHPKTALGLPEVKLGLLPGATGTQRLSRLVPLDMAVDCMLTGKNIFPPRAKAVGLVDEVVPPQLLRQVAEDRALKLAQKKLVIKRPSWPLPDAATLAANLKAARAMVDKQSKGVYPAPYKILDAIAAGIKDGLAAGFEVEAQGFGALAVSPEAKSLIHLFFTGAEAKKDAYIAHNVRPHQVERIGILGAGLMGAGVAAVSVDAGYSARMKDRDHQALGKGVAYVAEIIKEKYEKRRKPQEIYKRLDRLSSSIDYSGFKQVDFLIEAVFEDVPLKHQVIKEVEAMLPAHAIFASNTSAIPISLLAQASSRPDRFIGMHFFSPVHKMPLVEIIVTKETSPETLATTLEVTKRYGKTPIVVNDGFGFYTSRVIGRYVMEAYCAMEEGYRLEDLDKAAVKVGFPVGPVVLSDEVGIDVAQKAGKVIEQVFGQRMKGPDFIGKIVADNRLGRKNGRGFYQYHNGKKGPIDTTIYELIPHGYQRRPADLSEIAERYLYAFINESALCLAENILRTARDGDVGGVMGIGFPPNLGGPFYYADTQGLTKVVDTLKRLADTYGSRFQPAQILIDMAAQGKTFFGK